VRPPVSDLEELEARYREWHEQQGNDVSVGLRLGELLAGAGLEAVEHHGRYQILRPPPGLRSPGWAARDALVAAGLATPRMSRTLLEFGDGPTSSMRLSHSRKWV
jgi:hypothetical protein